MHQLDQRRPIIDKTRTATTSLPSNLRMLKAEGGSGLQKLLKEELRMTIMAKRHARGQADLKVDFPDPEPHELSLAELERRERRREQNRRAAQRCRRKKRINQLSVLQNYEWIVSRNQQLEQELELLRQERQRVHSVLRAHCQACTCPGHHALTSLLPHVLDPASSTTTITPTTPTVKVEPPGEEDEEEESMVDPATAVLKATGCFESVGVMEAAASSCEASSGWQQYDESSDCAMTPCSAGGGSSIGQQSYSSCSSQNGQPQPGSYPSTPFTTTTPFTNTTTTSSPAIYHHHHTPNDPDLNCLHGGAGGREASAAAGVLHSGASSAGGHQPVYSSGGSSLTSLVPAAAAVPYPSGGAQQCGALQGGMPAVPTMVGLGAGISSGGGGGTLSLLDELAYAPRGLRACVFQEEAATPLSADGRRSISSISSDVSSALSAAAAAEHPGDSNNGEAVPLPPDFYVTDDVSSSANDVSQLLSQINQSDLIFQQDEAGGLDEVFGDSVVGMNLSEHFLHSL